MVVGGRFDRLRERVALTTGGKNGDIVAVSVGRQAGECSRLEGFCVSLVEGVISAVLGVDSGGDDERWGVQGGVVVRIRRLSTSRSGIVGRFLDGLIHCRREVTDRAVVLVSSEAACDMDAIEKPMTGRDLGECGRRRVAICVDPESGSVVE